MVRRQNLIPRPTATTISGRVNQPILKREKMARRSSLNEVKKIAKTKKNATQVQVVSERVKEYFEENFAVISLKHPPGHKGKKLAKHKLIVLVFDPLDENQWFVAADISGQATLAAMVDNSQYRTFEGHNYIPLKYIEELGGRNEAVRKVIANNLRQLDSDLANGLVVAE